MSNHLFRHPISKYSTVFAGMPLQLASGISRLFHDNHSSFIMENDHRPSTSSTTRPPSAKELIIAQLSRLPVLNRLATESHYQPSKVHVVDEHIFAQCEDLMITESEFHLSQSRSGWGEEAWRQYQWLRSNLACIARFSLREGHETFDYLMIAYPAAIIKALCAAQTLRKLEILFSIGIDGATYEAPEGFWAEIAALSKVQVTGSIHIGVNFVQKGKIVHRTPKNLHEERICDWFERLQNLMMPQHSLTFTTRREEQPCWLLKLPQEL